VRPSIVAYGSRAFARASADFRASCQCGTANFRSTINCDSVATGSGAYLFTMMSTNASIVAAGSATAIFASRGAYNRMPPSRRATRSSPR
jgi:hypothetical protein